MSRPLEAAVAHYAQELRAYLKAGDGALTQASALGQEALALGLGPSELASLHAEALERDAAARDPTPGGPAWTFFTRALEPFEAALKAHTAALDEAERRHREQTRILHAIVESMSDGLVVMDRQGAFLVFNQPARRFFGLGPGDPLPSTAIIERGVFRPDGVTPFPVEEMPLVRALRGEITPAVSMFVKNEHLDEGVHVSVAGSPLRDEDGALVGGLAVFRDVTEARRAQEELARAEEQRRQAQKLEAVGRLAGGIAHDFNNLLTVILSHARLARSSVAERGELAEDLEEIAQAAQRAAALTKRLLVFSRQQVFAPASVDLDELLAGLDPFIHHLLGADVTLEARPGQHGGVIRADPSGVEQVLLTLVVNARDAMPAGGRLVIETAAVTVVEPLECRNAVLPPGGYVALSVTDTGTGMDAATLSRLFEPFFTTKAKRNGIGLGLCSVLGIVQASQGGVVVTSAPGRGSTFTLYFPRVEGEAARPSQEPSVTPPRGCETVLLAEDDDQVRRVTKGVLERSGYRVLEARDGVEALERAAAHAGPIDLLLTDLEMPRMGGAELAGRLVGVRPGTRVLCMSGYTGDGGVRQAIVDARLDYLEKPLTPEGLARKVRAVLDAPARPRA